MNKLTLDQQAMLAAWQQQTYAEFVLKDADAALAMMTEHPYVFMISSGTVRVGQAEVHEFYANHFLPKIPRISKSPPCRRPSATIGSSKKW